MTQNKVITHDVSVEGWTSFHTFSPDMMIGMNNKFFSFKNGNLYIHHQEGNRNTYYGEFSPTKLSVMVNKEPSTVKQLLSINLEGNQPWNIGVNAYINSIENSTQSSISENEFSYKEGMWFSYVRRREGVEGYDSKSTYGIGKVSAINGLDVTIIGGNTSLTIGDQIVKGSDLTVIGYIDAYDIATGTLTLSSVGTLAPNDFILGMKDTRVEGASMRGYTFRLDLESDSQDKLELFAVNSNLVKSYAK